MECLEFRKTEFEVAQFCQRFVQNSLKIFMIIHNPILETENVWRSVNQNLIWNCQGIDFNLYLKYFTIEV